MIKPAEQLRHLFLQNINMTAPVAQTLYDSLAESGISDLETVCLRFTLFEQASKIKVDGLAATLARQERLHTLWLTDGNFFTARQTEQIVAALNRSNCRNTLQWLSLRHSNFETKGAATQLVNLFAATKCLKQCWIDMQKG